MSEAEKALTEYGDAFHKNTSEGFIASPSSLIRRYAVAVHTSVNFTVELY